MKWFKGLAESLAGVFVALNGLSSSGAGILGLVMVFGIVVVLFAMVVVVKFG